MFLKGQSWLGIQCTPVMYNSPDLSGFIFLSIAPDAAPRSLSLCLSVSVHVVPSAKPPPGQSVSIRGTDCVRASPLEKRTDKCHCLWQNETLSENPWKGLRENGKLTHPASSLLFMSAN